MKSFVRIDADELYDKRSFQLKKNILTLTTTNFPGATKMQQQMESDVYMPTQSAVEVFYQTLFGCEIGVEKVTGTPPDEAFIVADYREPSGELRYMISLNYELANALGAALTMIPPRAAAEAAKEQRIPENIRENLQEVLNVCTSLFSVGMNGHHLAIGRVYEADEVSDPLQNALKGAIEVDYYAVSVPRYQDGCMAVYRCERPE